LKLLEEGHIVGIFPEGTRLKNKKGKNIKAKPGAALLAQKSGAPICLWQFQDVTVLSVK